MSAPRRLRAVMHKDERPPLTFGQVGAILAKVPALKEAWDEAKASGSTERKIRVTCPNEECSPNPGDKSQCHVTLDEDFIWCFKCKFGGRLDTAAAKMLGVKPIALLADIGADHFTTNEHYTVLGFKDDSNCRTMAVMKLKSGVLEYLRINGDKTNLRLIASEETFSRIFYPNRPDAEHDEATFAGAMGRRIVNAFEKRCEELRLMDIEFSEEGRRGRGVSIINGQPVYNLGAHVLRADGEISLFGADDIRHLMPGKRITQRPERALADAYDPAEFEWLFNLIRETWPLSECGAEFLLGWCCNSLVSGLHKSRPHLSFSGASSGGKSWLVDHVFERLVGAEYSGYVSKQSTPAGVRRMIANSSTGVFFDEAEVEKAGWDIVGWVIALMRKMADGKAVIQMADRDSIHGLVEVRPEAPVMLISNIEALSEKIPDIRRLFRVELKEGQRHNFDKEVGKPIDDLFDSGFDGRWRSYCLFNMPEITARARMIRRYLGDSGVQTGAIDMVSPLTASLAFSRGLTEERTQEMALQCAHVFQRHIATEGNKDWERVLSKLLSSNVADKRFDAREATIGEFVCGKDTGQSSLGEHSIDEATYSRILDRLGADMRDGHLRLLSSSDAPISDMIDGTGKIKTLLQNPDVKEVRIGNRRAVSIPPKAWKSCLAPGLLELYYPPENFKEEDIPL